MLEQNNDLFPVTESMLATMSFIPHKTEIKNCFHTMKGPTKKAMPNLIVHKDGKKYRVRAELLLFKGNQILLTKEDKVNHYGTYYKLPGGGIDNPLESIERAAARECEEEVLIVPKDVTYTGIEFSKPFTKIPEWHKVCLHPDGIYYDGFMSFICTAKYDREYNGYVKIVDRDAQASKAKFYPYPKVRYMLLPIHRKIADDFMKKKLDEDMRLFHMKPLNDLR